MSMQAAELSTEARCELQQADLRRMSEENAKLREEIAQLRALVWPNLRLAGAEKVVFTRTKQIALSMASMLSQSSGL